MPLSPVCPKCRTTYRVADNLAGKKIRCKKCEEIFRVEAEPEFAPVTVIEEPPPQRKPRTEEDMPRALPSRRRERAEEDDDRPTRRRRPLRDEDDDDDDDSRFRIRTEKVPREIRSAATLLIVVGCLHGLIGLILSAVLLSGQDTPREAGIFLTLIGLALLVLTSATAAFIASGAIKRGDPIGRWLAWAVAILCLPGFPLYTLIGGALIQRLTSDRARRFFELEDDDEKAAQAGIKLGIGGGITAVAWVGLGCLFWFVGHRDSPTTAANLPPTNVPLPVNVNPQPGNPLAGNPQPGNQGDPLGLGGALRRTVLDPNVTVLLPPNTNKQVIQSPAGPVTNWIVDRGNRGIAVTMSRNENLIGLEGQALDDVYGEVQKVLQQSFKAALTKSAAVTLATGQRGRYFEFHSAQTGMYIRGRVFVAGDRMVQLTASGAKPWIDSAEIDRFLASLEVTGKPVAQIPPIDKNLTLAEARKGFVTKNLRQLPRAKEPPTPPQGFRRAGYQTSQGFNFAYVTTRPRDNKKYPAIIWITGGDCNSIDEGCFTEGKPENEQSAAAYRKAGIVMMFPSLRGGNLSPGKREGFLGEVDDIPAAADYLAKQPYVDPERIYLGGHSTGGTLALLTAEYSPRFRAVFSFGPTHDPSLYPPEFKPFDQTQPREVQLRSPGLWLESVKTPTFVFEGTIDPANTASLRKMAQSTKNPNLHFLEVAGGNHFNILAPLNALLAEKVLRDEGPATNLMVTDAEVAARFKQK